jgi:transposase
MAEARRKFDREFREGALRIVREMGKPVAQVARELGVNDGTLGNWVAKPVAQPQQLMRGGPEGADLSPSPSTTSPGPPT